MANTTVNANVPGQKVREEHAEIQSQEQEWFDLRPIEKKLCGYSFALGIVLLVVFTLAFEAFH